MGCIQLTGQTQGKPTIWHVTASQKLCTHPLGGLLHSHMIVMANFLLTGLLLGTNWSFKRLSLLMLILQLFL